MDVHKRKLPWNQTLARHKHFTRKRIKSQQLAFCRPVYPTSPTFFWTENINLLCFFDKYKSVGEVKSLTVYADRYLLKYTQPIGNEINMIDMTFHQSRRRSLIHRYESANRKPEARGRGKSVVKAMVES